MALRKFGLSGRRRRLLACIGLMTSVVVLFLGQQQPHDTPHESVQRRNLNSSENIKSTEIPVPLNLRSQEEKLLSKIKEVASASLKKEMMLGKPLYDVAAPPKQRQKPAIVRKYNKDSIAVKSNEKEAGEKEVVEPPIKIVNFVPELKTKTINYTKYPPHLHPDRFKFIYKKERINTDGPKVNLIPEQTTWRHELNHETSVCNATDPFILAIVISAVHKKELREYIRRTWANPRLYPYTKIRSVFIVGATTDNFLQHSLDRENAQYSDIIQYNHIDSYGNLTYKSLAWLSWVGKHCPQAQFIAKIDDDVMVNPFHLRAFFEEKLKTPPIPKGKSSSEGEAIDLSTGDPKDNIATTYIYGRYDGVPYPLRNTKWKVSLEEYPEGSYPPFVHGPAYIVGRVAAKLMLKYAPYVPFLKLEDVYTTGLLAHAAQIKHVNIHGDVNTFKATSKLFNGTQALMEETNAKSRQTAWEGISLYAPVNIKELGTPYT